MVSAFVYILEFGYGLGKKSITGFKLLTFLQGVLMEVNYKNFG